MKNRMLVTGCALALAVAGFALWLLRPRVEYEQAYVRTRNATAWNRLAQVREPVVVLRYGERVFVVERKSGYAQVRMANGDAGWVDERFLMPEDLWRQASKLNSQARNQTLFARGKTKRVSNLRAEPGRNGALIAQLRGDQAVEVVKRSTAELAPEGETSRRAEPAKKEPVARREDWLLVRGRDDQAGEFAGWILGRFVEMDLPAPLRELGGGVHWLGWYELDRVSDTGGEKPQYLAVGSTGAEGQACDFLLLRVYTWHLGRHRYETAYVESNLCGRLPVQFIRQGQELIFSFSNASSRGQETREYRYRQNVVRRTRGASK